MAVVAFVISCILMQQDYILEFWYDFTVWLENKRMKWLAYPLGACEKCLAGQIALWIWLYINFSEYQTEDFAIAFFRHCIFIAFAIFFTWIIAKIE